MNILSYIHPVRAFLPCSGVGRHMNGVLTALAKGEGSGAEDATELSLLFSEEWLGADGKLPENCPLRALPFRTFPMRENRTERMWKLLNWPKMDRYIPEGTDWVYAPMETRLPVRRVPVAVTIHDIQAFETELAWSGTRAHRRFRRRWGVWIQKTLRECGVVFTVSEFSKRRMVELLGADPDRIVVSGNGLDASYLEGASEDLRGPDFDFPYVLIVGGLRAAKGGRWTLDVARALRDAGSALRVVVAGPNDPEMEAEARALGNFVFSGWVEDTALPPLYAQAEALLFLSPYEGYGIPAIEAMAMGTPAVVANCASLPEVVGSHGFVVDPARSAEVATLLSELSAGAQKYDAEAARDYAQQQTWTKCADRVLGALKMGTKA